MSVTTGNGSMSLFNSQFNGSLTMRSLEILEMGMGAAHRRRGILADNIANVDVPHFKRSELNFEMPLKRALESERMAREPLPLRTTQELHIDSRRFKDFRNVKPARVVDYLSKMRNDGNNVDIEDEMTKVARNQLQYSLMVDRLNGTFRQLNQLTRLA